MRVGCTGCLTGIVLIVVLVAGIGGTAWAVVRMLEAPALRSPAVAEADGFRAQQKVLEIARRTSGFARRSDPVALTEREINALLSRHVEADGLPLRAMTVKLVGGGVAEVAGQVPLRQLLTEAPLRPLGTWMSTAWLDRPVWVHVRGRPRVEVGASRDRHYLRIEIEQCWVGRQRVPVALLKMILDPTLLHALRWRLPATIDSVTVEPGRLVVRTASLR